MHKQYVLDNNIYPHECDCTYITAPFLPPHIRVTPTTIRRITLVRVCSTIQVMDADSCKSGITGTLDQSSRRRSLRALAMTDTDDRDIAAAAIIGDSKSPKNGYNTPAAIGTPAAL